MRITRRKVLAGAAIGGGVVLAWSLIPRNFETPLSPGADEIAFDAWLKIGADGVVTVAVPQLEMGQGVTTVLPQIVAMELGADWRQVAVEPAPVSGAYANVPLAALWAPLWQPLLSGVADSEGDYLVRRWAEAERFTATAAGTTLAAYEMPCREAGAAARAMLAMAAAQQWDVDWETCEAEAGFIVHGDQRASFGSLAAAASTFDPPDPPPLRTQPPAEIGPAIEGLEEPLAFPRLDLPSKVDGSHVFAADVRLPGMVFAAIRHGPHDAAELLDFDETLASSQSGLIKLVRGKRWLAAIAETSWAAQQALVKIAPRFAAERPASGALMMRQLEETLRDGPGFVVESRGAGLADYTPDISRRYEVAPALHATLETTTATARLADGILELWLPSQAPEAARAAAAKALGMSVSDVVLYPVSAGGSFDRRLDHKVAIQAALLAREAERPVQLTWSRLQEHTASYPRTPAVGLYGAKVGPEGALRTLRARIACPPTALEWGRRLFANSTTWAAIEEVAGEADPMAVSGALGPYRFANGVAEHMPAAINLPTARMRGGADGYTCFMRESFIDEIAAEAGREPMSYRIAMLGQDVLLADCLQRAARLADWDGGAPGTGQGIACHKMDLDLDSGGPSGRIAVVARAVPAEGGIAVSRLWACVDIGRVVNRDIALQQIEGGLLYGMALALGSATNYEGGLPTHQRLAALALTTLGSSPEIAVELVESDRPPFDPGEIGVPPVAPAIANAYFSASGRRLRNLPLLWTSE